MPDTKARIVGLGTIVVDLTMTVEQWPVPDTKVEASSSAVQVGGPVPTGLVLLQKLGHDCTLVSQWGDDPLGELIEVNLTDADIQFAETCRCENSATGTAHVWIDRASGQRTIVCDRVNPRHACFELTDELIQESDLLYLDGWPGESALTAAQRFQSLSKLVLLDAGSPKDKTDELLPLVDVLNVPRRFLSLFFGSDSIEQGGKKLLTMGPGQVTITDGANGVWYFSREESFHQPAFEVEAVDTTGAGDVFSAGIVHGLLQKWPAREMVLFAAACAALKCTQLGNREALPSEGEVRAFLGCLDPPIQSSGGSQRI